MVKLQATVAVNLHLY